MKYAIVKDSLVTNIVEWDGEGEYSPDGELVVATEDTKIGGSWDGNVFTFVVPEPEPDTRTYAEKRKPEYPPIGDQLDALLKHLNYRRTQGDELVQELDDIISSWLSVKSRFPKDD